MKQKKYTKRALCMSILSLLLCCSMLIGTTFAWFTDSVTSGKNKIVAGNLDVELEYAKSTATRDAEGKILETEWKTVESATDLFDSSLWEPGHTEYVYLRVRNAGTLALKYDMSMSTSYDAKGVIAELAFPNMDHEPFKLSEHLVYNVLNSTNQYEKREDLWLENEGAEKIALGKHDHISSPGVVLEAGESEAFTLAIYMPTWVGNEANFDKAYYKYVTETPGVSNPEGYVGGASGPQIYFGLTVNASQATVESDSFDNQYDKDALGPDGKPLAVEGVTLDIPEGSPLVFDFPFDTVTGENSTSVTIEEGALTTTGAGPHTAKLTVTIDRENSELREDGETVAIAGIDLSLFVDGEEIHNFTSGKNATVTTYLDKYIKGKISVEYMSDGGKDVEAITDVTYEPETGKLTFKTNHFSHFEIRKEAPETIEFEAFTEENYAEQSAKLKAALESTDKAKIIVLKDSEDSGFYEKNLSYYRIGDINITGDITLDVGNHRLADAEGKKSARIYVTDGGKLTISSIVDPDDRGNIPISPLNCINVAGFTVSGAESVLTIASGNYGYAGGDYYYGDGTHQGTGSVIEAKNGAVVRVLDDTTSFYRHEIINNNTSNDKTLIHADGATVTFDNLKATNGCANSTMFVAENGGKITINKGGVSSFSKILSTTYFHAITGGEIWMNSKNASTLANETNIAARTHSESTYTTVTEGKTTYYVWTAK